MARSNYLVRYTPPDGGPIVEWKINTAATFLNEGVTLKARDGIEYRILGPPRPVAGESLLVIDVEPADAMSGE